MLHAAVHIPSAYRVRCLRRSCAGWCWESRESHQTIATQCDPRTLWWPWSRSSGRRTWGGAALKSQSIDVACQELQRNQTHLQVEHDKQMTLRWNWGISFSSLWNLTYFDSCKLRFPEHFDLYTLAFHCFSVPLPTGYIACRVVRGQRLQWGWL